MKLNHINLGVTDVPATVALFEEYFGLKPAEGGFPQNPAMAFLTDDDGSLISIFRARDVTYPKVFHIGFIQENAEAVRAMHAKLQAGGFQPQEPREEHGRLTFYFDAPGGFVIEVDAFL